MLDEKTKELIAVGAAVTANCQSCLDVRCGKARALGASDADIRAAISMGVQVRSGAAAKLDRFASGLSGAEARCDESSPCC